eukprot:3148923-Prymnesium_polylepis.1
MRRRRYVHLQTYSPAIGARLIGKSRRPVPQTPISPRVFSNPPLLHTEWCHVRRSDAHEVADLPRGRAAHGRGAA